MNPPKNKNGILCTLFCLIFTAAIYPYNHDMYIPEVFTLFCAALNLASGVLFAVLLYRKLEGTFPAEDGVWGFAWYLLLQVPGHCVFAMMNWGSWVCLGLTVLAYLALWCSWRKMHPMRFLPGKRGKLVILLLTAVVVLTVGILRQPWIRAQIFVVRYGEDLEQRNLTAEEGNLSMPTGTGVERFNLWPGEHAMVEYQFHPKNAVYVGCYYSYDDVPLAFQNIPVKLIPAGEGQWTWQAKGDNHGMTRKIKDHWYYFEASF